jgi:hypothetical protein
VGTVRFRQVMWFVMLESAKDWILEVDTTWLQLPPRVRYGMTCLPLRVVVGCESCSMVWGKTHNMWWSTMCKRGSGYVETLALQAWIQGQGKPYQSMTNSYSRPWSMTCNDLWAIHQRKYKNWQKGGSLVTDRGWNHYTWVHGTNLCKV